MIDTRDEVTSVQAPLTRFIATIVRRREPVQDRYYDSPQYQVQEALDQRKGAYVSQDFASPIQSGFHGIGRDAHHDPTPHRFYQSLDIDARLAAIGGWPFSVPKIPGALVVGMPKGRWNAQAPRVNIQSGKPMAYGNMASLSSPLVSNNEYAKLMI